MSTVEPENVTIDRNVTYRKTDDRSKVTATSQGRTTLTETTRIFSSAKVTENKTEIVNETTTTENGRTTTTERTKTTTSKESVRTSVNAQSTTMMINERNRTTTKEVTTSTPIYITTEGVVTDVTSTKISHPVTSKSSTKKRVISDYTSTDFPFTNVSFNSTVSNMVVVSTNVDASIGVKKISDDCTETIAIVIGLCAGLVLLNLLVSVLCFFRLRHKWRAKIQLERKKTDIWSMATYNNTIINENFGDYQLASTTNQKGRKTSRFSEDSIQFYDPFADTMSQSRFASNHDDIVMRNVTLPSEARADFSTLRRNTVSAPEELDSKLQTLRVEPDHFGFSDDRNTLRGRSSTFTVGRKNNVDRHVLLSHEELVDDQSVVDIGQTGSKYNLRTNSYHITEL